MLFIICSYFNLGIDNLYNLWYNIYNFCTNNKYNILVCLLECGFGKDGKNCGY